MRPDMNAKNPDAASTPKPYVKPSYSKDSPDRREGELARPPFKKAPFKHKGKDFGAPTGAPGKPAGDKPFAKPYKAKKKLKAQ